MWFRSVKAARTETSTGSRSRTEQYGPVLEQMRDATGKWARRNHKKHPCKLEMENTQTCKTVHK